MTPDINPVLPTWPARRDPERAPRRAPEPPPADAPPQAPADEPAPDAPRGDDEPGAHVDEYARRAS